MSTKQAIASNDNEKALMKSGSNTVQQSDYINHYLGGNPIIYIYRVNEYVDKNTGAITWFYKGNMKTGLKTGDKYIPIEGSLSDNALKVLEPLIDLLDAEDPAMRRSVGVTAKTPRFEGVSAFIPNGDTEPVGVAKFRLNYILNIRVFQKGKSDDPMDTVPEREGGDPGFSDQDIPH